MTSALTVRLDEETARELAELAERYRSRSAATWVGLTPADPLAGFANADCIEQLGKDELREYLGALSPASMRNVGQALAIALGLT